MSGATPACSGTKRAPYAPGRIRRGDKPWSDIRRLHSSKTSTPNGNRRCDFQNHLKTLQLSLKAVPHLRIREEDSSPAPSLWGVPSDREAAAILMRTTCRYPVSLVNFYRTRSSTFAYLWDLGGLRFSLRKRTRNAPCFNSIDSLYWLLWLSDPKGYKNSGTMRFYFPPVSRNFSYLVLPGACNALQIPYLRCLW